MIEIISKLSNKLTDFGFAVGYFSEIILLILVSYLLYYQSIADMGIFIAGFFASGIANGFLKNMIKDRRPKDPERYLAAEHFSKKPVVYGLPSGHSQNVFYCIIYLYLVSTNFVAWEALLLVIATLMFYERWVYHNHTIIQLITGAVVGVAFGYGVFSIRNYVMKNI